MPSSPEPRAASTRSSLLKRDAEREDRSCRNHPRRRRIPTLTASIATHGSAHLQSRRGPIPDGRSIMPRPSPRRGPKEPAQGVERNGGDFPHSFCAIATAYWVWPFRANVSSSSSDSSRGAILIVVEIGEHVVQRQVIDDPARGDHGRVGKGGGQARVGCRSCPLPRSDRPAPFRHVGPLYAARKLRGGAVRVLQERLGKQGPHPMRDLEFALLKAGRPHEIVHRQIAARTKRGPTPGERAAGVEHVVQAVIQ